MSFQEKLRAKLERTEIDFIKQRVEDLIDQAVRVEILKEQPVMSCQTPGKTVIYKNDMKFENKIILHLELHLPGNAQPNDLVKLKKGGRVDNKEDWELVD